MELVRDDDKRSTEGVVYGNPAFSATLDHLIGLRLRFRDSRAYPRPYGSTTLGGRCRGPSTPPYLVVVPSGASRGRYGVPVALQCPWKGFRDPSPTRPGWGTCVSAYTELRHVVQFSVVETVGTCLGM